MFFRKGQALGSVQVTDSGDPDEKKAVSMADLVAEAQESVATSPEPPPATPATPAEPKPTEDEKPVELERPKVADPKADWIEYAVSKGMERELAEDPSTTKQDLIDSYGG